MSHLLRIVLPDRPGMLGAVATALGGVGADIVSLDVVERGPYGAVDDILVSLPPGGLADRLLTAAQSVPGVVVESLRPYAGGTDLHRDLEFVEVLATADAPVAVLATHLPGVFRAGWAVAVEAGVGVLAASEGAPDTAGIGTPWLPLTAARAVAASERWPPERWRLLGTELAVAPLGSPDRAVILGRPGGPSFRASEVLRLQHLSGIAGSVAQTREPLGSA